MTQCHWGALSCPKRVVSDPVLALSRGLVGTQDHAMHVCSSTRAHDGHVAVSMSSSHHAVLLTAVDPVTSDD